MNVMIDFGHGTTVLNMSQESHYSWKIDRHDEREKQKLNNKHKSFPLNVKRIAFPLAEMHSRKISGNIHVYTILTKKYKQFIHTDTIYSGVSGAFRVRMSIFLHGFIVSPLISITQPHR